MIKENKKEQILEQDINCQYTIQQEVIINQGLYRNNKAIIQSVRQEQEHIIYKVFLKILDKKLELEFDETKLKPVRKFKIPFIN